MFQFSHPFDLVVLWRLMSPTTTVFFFLRIIVFFLLILTTCVSVDLFRLTHIHTWIRFRCHRCDVFSCTRTLYYTHIYICRVQPDGKMLIVCMNATHIHKRSAHILSTQRDVCECVCVFFFSHHRRRRRPSISTSVNVLHSDSQSFVDIQTVRMRSGQSRDTAFVILII